MSFVDVGRCWWVRVSVGVVGVGVGGVDEFRWMWMGVDECGWSG